MSVETQIKAELEALEKREGLKVLYACESGSRAWGFPSTDSDYDVRFLYVRPIDWYLSVQPRRDVVECEMKGLLDISGWDLQKALRLLYKSNPPLLEWLRSPIVYLKQSSALERLRTVAGSYFSPRSSIHHYLHMAEGNYREYLQGEEVRLKKYFYVLRPLLACSWIERTGEMAPMEFHRLVESELPTGELKAGVMALLERKMASQELDLGPRIQVVNDYIEDRLATLKTNADKAPKPRVSYDALDELFRAVVREVY
ncbi:MAG: nucleotidyltransferase domain-containing protein [Bdellovibrionota bacterium]